MVSSIPTHAKPACAVRSFAISKVQLLHIQASGSCENLLAISAHLECGKSEGVLA